MSTYDPRQFVTWEARALELIERLDDGIEPTDSLDELRRLIEVTSEDCRMRMVRLPEAEWGQQDPEPPQDPTGVDCAERYEGIAE